MGEQHKIRVLQVLGSLDMGGAESRIMDVYRSIDRKLVSFDFLILKSGKQYYEEEVRELGGVIFHEKMPGINKLFHHINSVRKIIREGRYDVVHAHTSYHCGLIMYAAWRERVPVRIAHSRTTGSKRNGIFKKLMFVVGKILISLYATKRFAISYDAGRFLFGSDDFEVLPNAIDVSKYQATSKERIQELKQEFSIPDGAVVVGQVGRFHPMKNHKFTIKWFSQYVQSHCNSVLILVGDGNLKAEIISLAKEFHIDNRVRFVGIRSDIEEVLHVFDILFFPSIYEGLGGVILESQAAGVPAVISDSIPQDVDLRIGLVYRCNLNSSNEIWSDMVDRAIQSITPNNKIIAEAFEKKKYSLSFENNRLLDEYSKGIR